MIQRNPLPNKPLAIAARLLEFAFDGKILLKIPMFFPLNKSRYAIFSDNSMTIALANR